jgi:hypothetical protein
MNRKTVVSVLSFAIACSFYFPLFDWHHFEMSGLNYLLSDHTPVYKYVLLLIPCSASFLFFDALSDQNHFFKRKIISWLPVLTLLFIIIMRYLAPGAENSLFDNESAFLTIDIGFWLILVFSILVVIAESQNNFSEPFAERTNSKYKTS